MKSNQSIPHADQEMLSKLETITDGIPVFDLKEIKRFALAVRKRYILLGEKFNQDVSDISKIANIEELDNLQLLKQLKPDSNLDWGINDVLSMWAKGLNPSALTATSSTTRYFVKHAGTHHPENPDRKVFVELGSGAGWSTLILANEVIKNSEENTLFSFDRSLSAIACTATLLRKYGIKYRIIESTEIQKHIPESRGKVILVYDEKGFNNGIKYFETNQIDGVYSNHGDAYTDAKYRLELMSNILKICKSGSIYLSDCLNNEYSLSFSKIWVMWQMTLGRPLSKKLKLEDKELIRIRSLDGEKHITHMLDKFSKPILDLGNHYIRRDRKSFKLLLSCLALSTLWQRNLISAVKSPTKIIDKDFLERCGNSANSGKQYQFEKIQPEVPVYISSIAVRIRYIN